jgi:hypothetical protein
MVVRKAQLPSIMGPKEQVLPPVKCRPINYVAAREAVVKRNKKDWRLQARPGVGIKSSGR